MKVDKPWGHEIIWANSEKITGKVLHIKKGHRLSLQYHEKKEEGIDIVASVIVKCESYNFYIKCIDTCNKSDISEIYDTKLYWFDDKDNNLPHENPQWNEIKLELQVEDN